MAKRAKKSKRWSPKYLIVCDEVRFENNGKEMIIGIYSDAIVVPSVPVRLKTLTFRISVVVDGKEYREVSFELRGNGGVVGARISGPVDPNMIGKTEARFIFELPGVELKSEGVKTLWLGLDSELEKVGEFEVRVASAASK